MHTVTGATGLLGSHLVVHLIQNGDPVRVIHRAGSDLGKLRKVLGYYLDKPDEAFEQIEFKTADLLDVDMLWSAMRGTDYLYHCAAYVSFNPRDQDKVLNGNPEITANVANCALDLTVEKMVYVSSVAALGRQSEQDYYDEKSEWVESGSNSNYAKGKYLAELQVWRAMEEGLNAAIVNPTIILGSGNWSEGSAALIDTIARGFKFYSTGSNGFVDARDVAAIMRKLMFSEISNERFITVAENRSFKEVFHAVARELGVTPPTIKAGSFLTGLVWRMEMLRSRILGGNPAVTRESAKSAQSHNHYRNEKVKRALDFEFRPLEESIRDFCELYRRDHPELFAES